MKPSQLAEKSHLHSKSAKLVINAFEKPDIYIQRLYERSKDSQWSIDAIDWGLVDFKRIPVAIRQAAVNMFCQLSYGEVTAFMGSARMADAAPNGESREFFTLQTEDEARHMQWFSSLIAAFECESKVLASVQHLMDDVYACDSLEEMVVGMHIIIEGMAHSFFLEGTEAFSRASLLKPFLGEAYSSVNLVFNNWLPNFLGRDEGRHLAFGVYFLKNRIKQLSTKNRDALEKKTQYWVQLYRIAAADPAMLAVPGLDSKGILERTNKRINNHFSHIGLEARI